MLTLLSIAALTAAGANAGWPSLSVGGFGSASLPQKEMTANGYRTTSYNLHAGDANPSGALGIKGTLDIIGGLSADVAVARHFNYGPKNPLATADEELPRLTLTALTAGVRYGVGFGPAAIYAGAGGGYYWQTMGLIGGVWANVTYEYHGDVSFDAPGAYGALTLALRRGRLAVEAGPVYHAIWNKGRYDYEYEVWETWPDYLFLGTRSAAINKLYNDQFIEIRFGVNYALW